MIVKEIKKKGNNVFVNFKDGDELVIPYDIYLKNFLSIDDEISQNLREKIEAESELYKVKQSCFRYLSGRNHSKYELKVKLLKKKYRKDIIEKVLNSLIEEGLIDDTKYAKDYYVTKKKKNRGPLKIKTDLFKRGINRDIISAIVSEDTDQEIFFNKALLLAKRKMLNISSKGLDNRKTKQRIYTFLVGRGFTSDIIISVLNELEFHDE